MKKLLLVAVVALMGSSVVKAQETRFGVKAGYSMSTLKYESDLGSEESDPMHTFYVGGLVEHKFGDKFGIQGELLYSPLGGKVVIREEDEEDPGNFFNLKSKTTLGTLLIPVSAKYFITEGLSVSAGASFGIILSAKQKTVFDGGLNIPGIEIGAEDETDVKDQTNTLNIAPFVGAEYMLENGLFFDARYNLGVSNLVKNPEFNETSKNSFFQIGVGFKFGGN
ncbi:porin family protein [Chryseobacterium sp. 2TAF14]|jgi:opacity protein-like surface antigen|uniref:porin family protein n=1 Tax=Chryseobacterium sp. 2TAF14 TaxID=3233007 RepID=UPI003F908100